MNTIIFPAKMSGTGTIHDTASSNFDREIKFPSGKKYAVVLSAYYGHNLYTVHATETSAIKKSRKEREFSHVIIDDKGNRYTIQDDELIVVGKQLSMTVNLISPTCM